MNMALPRGTGVATYGRNLCTAIRSYGYTLHLVCGENLKYRRSPELREAEFFNTLSHPTAYILRRARMKLAARALIGLPIHDVPETGKVVRPAGDTYVKGVDFVWNVRALYAIAPYYFTLFRRFLSVPNPGGIDVMHWTYPLPIRMEGAKNVYTVHDLAPLRLPYVTLDHKPFMFDVVKLIARDADLIATVSEASRTEIINFFDVESDRVVNTYQCVDLPRELLDMRDEKVQGEIASTFNLKPKGYFFYYGAIEPKKNIMRLIEAYFASDVKVPLIIGGQLSWLPPEDLRMLKDMGLYDGNESMTNSGPREGSKEVRFLNHLPFRQLVMLIRNAKAVTFPSVYEGFGLPAIEAMACGTPVVTSNFGALKEVCGEAALFVDPYDTGSIAAGLDTIATDEALCKKLAEAGPQRAATFSAKRFADLSEEKIYEPLLAGKHCALKRGTC
ncbi:MAG: hypothetical protein Rhirs2KO_19060 [Rhizobiaceae bacterium]